MDGVWKVYLLGLSPRSVSSSPPSPMGSPPSPFILVFYSRSSHTCPFLLVWGGHLSYQFISRSGWEKLDSMVWVWVCQALGSTIRCWQLSSLCCSCTESVLFFRRCCETLTWSRHRPHPWAFKELSLRVLGNRAPRPGLWALNTKWAGTSDFGPHSTISRQFYPSKFLNLRNFFPCFSYLKLQVTNSFK